MCGEETLTVNEIRDARKCADELLTIDRSWRGQAKWLIFFLAEIAIQLAAHNEREDRRDK